MYCNYGLISIMQGTIQQRANSKDKISQLLCTIQMYCSNTLVLQTILVLHVL